MSDVTTEAAPRADTGGAAVPHLGWALAGLSAGAGLIHVAMVPAHAGDGLVDPLGFAAVAWFQLAVAAVILTGRGERRLYALAAVGNLAVIGLWAWSRTAGLPVGTHAGVVEEATGVDMAAVALQVGAVLVAARLLLAPARASVGRLAPALAAVAALGLTTAVIVSPEASGHGGGDHAHGDAGGHADLMAQIDEERCDHGFNIPAYWSEADALGIDVYQGGAMSAADHHDHGATATGDGAEADPVEPDPTGGRGSAELDELVSLTSQAEQGEAAAGRLVSKLAEVDDETYDIWLWWLNASGALGHEHHDSAAPGDAGGHGGHVGPQPWVAMTDPAECEQLAEELALARDVALRYPTAADATAAGWTRVTPYVPGIAAHYMNFSYVDAEFDIEEPEMILYDGNGPDARVVGLSYYITLDGTNEPTQGFTGANDHYHRHVGLCQGPGGVIGDSTTTAEECEARGGRKADGSNGWMSHAWVVPGCESPWGVFSAASPTLDRALAEASGEGEGGCAGSAVRDRYSLPDPLDIQPIRATVPSGD